MTTRQGGMGAREFAGHAQLTDTSRAVAPLLARWLGTDRTRG